MAGLLKATIPCLVFVLFLVLSFSEATEFLLNNKHNSWAIPSSPDEFKDWSQKLRFVVGDSVVVEYDPKSDSVLEVSEDDYKTCNKDKPIKSYQDDRTLIELDRSGPFYFISGADDNCEKGQKFKIVVLNEKHASKTPPAPQPPSPSPSPSTSEDDSDVPAPAQAPVSAKKAKSDALRTSVGVFVAALSLVVATLVVFSLV